MIALRYDRAVRTGRWAIGGAAFASAFSALLLFAYNPLQENVNGAPVPDRWPNATFTWNLNPPPPTATNLDTTDRTVVATTLSNAAGAWPSTQLHGQTINNLSVAQGPDSTASDPNSSDCLNVVSFSPSSSVKFPTGSVAFTAVSTVYAGPGQPGPPYTFTACGNTIKTSLPAIIVDADIAFNPAQPFSTTTPPSTGRFDVQSVATHEFGHALGLDHGGIARAVMFPFGDAGLGQQRQLWVDDVAGVAFLYQGPDFKTVTGTISGQVTLTGTGIYASHVVVVDAGSGAAVLDALTNPDGTYTLAGVPAGVYNVLALPLAPDANSGIYTIDDFSGWTCGYGENAPPCCDPKDPTCTGTARQVLTNYSGKFF